MLQMYDKKSLIGKNAKWEDRTDNIFYKAYEEWTIYDGYATPFYFMKQL